MGGRFVITSIFDLTLSPQIFFLDIEMVHFFVKLKARFSFFLDQIRRDTSGEFMVIRFAFYQVNFRV